MALDFERKICEPARFSERAHALARPLVFTNGVFDILHRGSSASPSSSRSIPTLRRGAWAREPTVPSTRSRTASPCWPRWKALRW
jgi:hypothetical protein